jgi:hypothetical protein
MQLLGKMTTIAAILGLAVAVSFGWRSRGDIGRYLKMRNM